MQGHLDYKFSNAAASMLLFRLKGDFRRDPTHTTLLRAVEEMHAFFCKYQRILAPDIAAIFN